MTVSWHHYPWLAGLALAPLLFGSVNTEGQAVVGVLFASSLLLVAPQRGSDPNPLVPALWKAGAVLVLILPLIPLPSGLVSIISPARAALAGRFPIESGVPVDWMPLAVSFSSGVQRLWELSLVLACFCLARLGGREPGFPVLLAWVLAATLVLLAASDVWGRAHGRESVLGIWRVSWGRGAGTFANPNHFAHWTAVAGLFVAGAVLRDLLPFHAARRGTGAPIRARPLRGLCALAGLAVALAAMVGSGSRGGALALVVGGAGWLFVLATKTRSQRRWAVVAFLSLGLFLGFMAVGEVLLRRMAEVKPGFLDHYPKLQIWQQSLPIFTSFPIFGVGWGGFAAVLNHLKTRWGDSTCWHAENDYLQLLIENGLLGAVVLGGVVLLLLLGVIRRAWRTPSDEPELVLGALAGLAAFAFGALYEFVFQITANAVLAAALLGFAVGRLSIARAPAVTAPPTGFRLWLNFATAVALGAVAFCQGAAFWHWREARKARNPVVAAAHLEKSLRWWPWASNRQIAWTRQRVLLASPDPAANAPVRPEQIRSQLTKAIARDPFNWELRLERAWLDLAFFPRSPLGLIEARETVRLNPLQPQIPLRFARYLARVEPERALEFLLMMDRSSPALLRQALALSWNIDPQTSFLWSLTPPTLPGLTTLGDFAVEQKLHSLAAQAFLLLSKRIPPLELAAKLLEAQRPDLAIAQLLGRRRDVPTLHLLCRAYDLEGNHDEVVRLVDELVRIGLPAGETAPAMKVEGELAESRAKWTAEPGNDNHAGRLAEKLFALPASQRDLPLLRRLAEGHGRSVRLAWMVYQTERELGSVEGAAESGVLLAGRIAALGRN